MKIIKESFKNAGAKIKGVSRSQWWDLGLFVSVAATFYFFGDKISDKVDEVMPTEEKMVEMMKEMQA